MTDPREAALVYRGDTVADIVGPLQRKVYRRAGGSVRIERLSIDDSRALDGRTRALLAAAPHAWAEAVYVRAVPAGHEGHLLVDGAVTAVLPAGVHALWRLGRTVEIEIVDLRLQSVDIDEQALITRDRVSLRVDATVTYRLRPNARSMRAAADVPGLVCSEARAQVRSAVSVRGLEALLADGGAVEDAATAAAAARLADIGIEVRRIGIRALVLPRELRRLLNATYAVERQLLGLRVRELQAIERVAEQAGSLSVFAGLDWLAHGAVRLKP